MIASALALLIMQVGPNPSVGGMPGIPDELANRSPRATTEQTARPASGNLSRCLSLASTTPDDALDFAQAWRETGTGELDNAQAAHCAGLALVGLDRFSEARRLFEQASSEVPDDNAPYRARLMAMAGNAALAGGDAVASEPLFAQAVQTAANSGDASLIAGLQVDHARALVASGRPDDAARVLADARTSDASNLRAWLLSATLSRRLQRLGEAQKQIEQAAILGPRDPAVGLEAGVIAALSGREDDARRSFESVLVVDPDSDEANRARAYLEQLGQ